MPPLVQYNQVSSELDALIRLLDDNDHMLQRRCSADWSGMAGEQCRCFVLLLQQVRWMPQVQ